jgi:hypothetical protein
MERFVWICLAGVAGTGARYLLALSAAQALACPATLPSAITIGFIGSPTT